MAEDERPMVLVVDDEQEVLKLMYRQLAQLPYNIVPTTSPAEALHLIQTQEVAVLLCDLNMPHTDGNVILSKARAANPHIVSVAISGGADTAMTIKAVNEGGIWKYITKPWKHDELNNLVNDGVERYLKLRRPQSKLKELAQAGDDTSAPDSVPERVAKPPRRVIGKKAELGVASADNGGLSGILGDRYELGGILGEGGIGTVYKAQDLFLNMPVAVKILNAEVSGNELAIATLKDEARIAMQLSHKHIVRLHNLQKEGRHYYLVMEYVKGQTLWDIVNKHGALALDSVLQIVYVCSDAISYAHRHGVLHKDLKPDNILLDEDGVLKIIDFGIACLANAQSEEAIIMGTPAYMSPEQLRGEKLDARSDIYSLGMIVYELLTGKPPFPGDITLENVWDHLPADVSNLPVSPEIADVIECAVALHSEDRFESMFAFSTALIDAAQSSRRS